MDIHKHSTQSSHIPELNVQADRELARRSPKVALTMVPVIALVTFITDLHAQALELSLGFLALSTILGFYRVYLAFEFDDLYKASPRSWMNRFAALMLFSAGIYGLAVPAVYFAMGSGWTMLIVLLSVTGMSASATSSIAPRQNMFRSYVGLMLVPITLVLFVFGNMTEKGLGMLVLFFLGQLLVLGSYSHRVFWDSLRNAHLLEERAENLTRAKAEVEAANEAKSEFLNNVSHEIRTPLNGILGLTDMVLETKLDPQQEEHLKIVRSSGDTLLEIINEILDFSRLESRGLKLESKVFNLRQVIRKVAVQGELSCRENGNSLKVELDEAFPVEVIGDESRLLQILNNLVSNAVKFTKLGTILLQGELVHRQDGLAAFTLRVQDNGIGIAPEVQKDIFQAFKQVDGSTTRAFGGTGLGLALSHQLAELMGGKITLESETGKGSTFSLHLALPELTAAPQEDAPPETPAAVPRAPETERSTTTLEGMQVLLVEDNTVNAKLATRILEKSGIHVAWAENGQEAVAPFLKGSFAVVLMDIQMPILDGFGATQAIREGEEGTDSHIPIIALTAHAMEGYREKCLAAGMDDYLTKPMQPKNLKATLEKWNRRSLNPSG